MNVTSLLKGLTVLSLGFLFLTSCRGQFSKKPPIHPNPNMDNMSKIKPQRGYLNINEQGARQFMPPEGTVAWGRNAVTSLSADRENLLKEDDSVFTGMVGGSYVKKIPPKFVVDEAFLDRGQERYNIYCAACHGGSGDGKGPVSSYGLAATSFNDPKLVNITDGYIYETITLGSAKGTGAMKGYAKQIPVDDRWAIVAYVRALQLNLKSNE